MRIRQILGLAAVFVVLLFITATYVQYSNKLELYQQRGGYYVKAEGRVYLTGGELYAVINEFKGWFDATPDIPTYREHIGQMFDFGSSKPASVADNQTFTILNVVITQTADGMSSRNLLDKSIKIPYLWAGGDIGTNGEIGSFSYNLGPYVAYSEFSPLKITCQVNVGTTKTLDSFYLTIPNLSEVTDG